ncbi:MAG: BrnT family toxin [Rhodobacteraceae bacterium]|jgi:uncharacterized DUF497 family protein|nr:BrnT family toxin [Paracoccaceae bacterium]
MLTTFTLLVVTGGILRLDFADVVQLEWDPTLIFDDERHNYGERRKTALGLLDGRLVVIAFTERNNNLRIISMRKANNRETKIYAKF